MGATKIAIPTPIPPMIRAIIKKVILWAVAQPNAQKAKRTAVILNIIFLPNRIC